MDRHICVGAIGDIHDDAVPLDSIYCGSRKLPIHCKERFGDTIHRLVDIPNLSPVYMRSPHTTETSKSTRSLQPELV